MTPSSAGSVFLADDNVLHIGGIFPIKGQGGWQGGQACHPAAQLALDDVNARSDLLPGYELQLHWNDSEVNIIQFGNRLAESLFHSFESGLV